MPVNLLFNPFEVVIKAYEALYNKPCDVSFVEGLHKRKRDPWGCTEFDEKGIEVPYISIDINCPLRGAVEILAHELAHVATGDSCESEHGTEWESCFSAIHEKYTELVMSTMPEGTKLV